MKATKQTFLTVEQYIDSCDSAVRPILKKLRAVIKKGAPRAIEMISYGMPFYEYGGKGYAGRLIYFAAFKKHISVFIAPRLSESIPPELKKYHVSKATYQFSLTEPFPYALIEQTLKSLVQSRDSLSTPDEVTADIAAYNNALSKQDKELCNILHSEISKTLKEAESKVWHRHPVWFLDGNPIVGYSKQKNGIRLMFWSGADFEEPKLSVQGKKFKDASIFYTQPTDINTKDLTRWLKKSRVIQWDYKNIVKRKGKLVRL